jgi:acetyl/propionyl-CoA carboxylase alpha subunit
MRLTLLHGDREYKVDILADGRVRVGDDTYDVQHERDGMLRVGGLTLWVAATHDARWVFVDGRVYELSEPRPKARRRVGHDPSLSAPMPATVRRIAVGVGDVVKTGDVVIVLEAMKMELPIRAAQAGTVRAVHCVEGELVQPGVPLLEVSDA